jgi:hypothetical protein
MKKKPLHKTTIKDLTPLLEKGQSQPTDNSTAISTYETFYNKNTVQAILDYNTNVINLDPSYTSLKPINKLLVRVFLKEIKVTESGLIIPNTEMVKRPTHSGYGSIDEVESPFPYSQKAVVVAVPPFVKDIEPGDIVYLNTKPIKPEVVGTGQEAMITIPNAFIHPELGSELTTDFNSPLYGYLKINYTDIDFKL